MAIHVFRSVSSVGARTLSRALNASRIFNTQRVRRGDTIIAWGEALEPIDGVNVLNGAPIRSKYTDAEMLRAAGIATIEVSRTRPLLQEVRNDPQVTPELIEAFEEAKELAEEFSAIREVSLAQPLRTGISDLVSYLEALNLRLSNAAQPVVIPGGPDPAWFGRLNNHVGGADILNPPAQFDYFVKRETFTNEYRVHSFAGRSIHAGKKVVREGFVNPHPWVRSFDGGWMISYAGDVVRQRHRDIAHQACQALGLTFGAVDVGERADNTLCVLEVNRAPGIEGGTVEAYVRAINRYIQERSGDNGIRRAA